MTPIQVWRARGRELVVTGRGRRIGALARLFVLDERELLLVFADDEAVAGAPASCDAPFVIDAVERGALHAAGAEDGGPYRSAEHGERGPAYALLPAVHGATLAGAVRRARGGARWETPSACALGAAIAQRLVQLAPPLVRLAPSAVVVGEDGAVRVRSAYLEWARTARPHGVLVPKDAWLSYLRPEALDRAPPRVGDTYGLGVLLFELLAGASLFARAGEHATLLAIARAVVPPLSALHADVPSELAALIAAMLARDPNLRPTAERAQTELARFAGAARIAALPDEPTPDACLAEP